MKAIFPYVIRCSCLCEYWHVTTTHNAEANQLIGLMDFSNQHNLQMLCQQCKKAFVVRVTHWKKTFWTKEKSIRPNSCKPDIYVKTFRLLTEVLCSMSVVCFTQILCNKKLSCHDYELGHNLVSVNSICVYFQLLVASQTQNPWNLNICKQLSIWRWPWLFVRYYNRRSYRN